MISSLNKKIIRKRKFLNRQAGFTLVEMLVSIAVFMSVMVVAVGAFISIVNANKKSQAMKSVVDNVTFAIDNISRSMKVGNDYKCGIYSGASMSFECAGEGGNAFQYHDINDLSGRYVQYAFIKTVVDPSSEGNIQRRYCTGNDSNGCDTWQSLTGPVNNINIKNMKFYVLGTGTEGYTRNPDRTRRQPRVVITVEGSGGDSSRGLSTDFILQTTVSQMDRNNN